jgi:hypothetical protein
MFVRKKAKLAEINFRICTSLEPKLNIYLSAINAKRTVTKFCFLFALVKNYMFLLKKDYF